VEKQSPIIEIIGLFKSFGKDKDVLKGVNIDVQQGENLVVLGKSGSGKSITIKCLVRLVKADKGEIKVFGKDLTKLEEDGLNQIRLRIGFLFQNGALYDSMSVRENLAFPLQRHRPECSEEQVNIAIEETLESVGLIEAIDKMPSCSMMNPPQA
jgi:phospholipid/cholesterol/gamma-HCH transport system ATP-binding protein